MNKLGVLVFVAACLVLTHWLAYEAGHHQYVRMPTVPVIAENKPLEPLSIPQPSQLLDPDDTYDPPLKSQEEYDRLYRDGIGPIHTDVNAAIRQLQAKGYSAVAYNPRLSFDPSLTWYDSPVQAFGERSTGITFLFQVPDCWRAKNHRHYLWKGAYQQRVCKLCENSLVCQMYIAVFRRSVMPSPKDADISWLGSRNSTTIIRSVEGGQIPVKVNRP